MIRFVTAATAAMIALVPLGAAAQERVGDAALGAVSGAIVLGPVGAVAGAVVGFTAGPSIARAWGLRQSPPPPQARRATPRPRQAAARPRTASQDVTGTTQAAEKSRAESPHNAMPPVQALE